MPGDARFLQGTQNHGFKRAVHSEKSSLIISHGRREMSQHKACLVQQEVTFCHPLNTVLIPRSAVSWDLSERRERGVKGHHGSGGGQWRCMYMYVLLRVTSSHSQISLLCHECLYSSNAQETKVSKPHRVHRVPDSGGCSCLGNQA